MRQERRAEDQEAPEASNCSEEAHCEGENQKPEAGQKNVWKENQKQHIRK